MLQFLARPIIQIVRESKENFCSFNLPCVTVRVTLSNMINRKLGNFQLHKNNTLAR